MILMQKAGGGGERTSGEWDDEGDELWSIAQANKVILNNLLLIM
jgi:hypothetical protein